MGANRAGEIRSGEDHPLQHGRDEIMLFRSLNVCCDPDAIDLAFRISIVFKVASS